MSQPIFIYWHQGWDSAPNLVKRCAESWVHHHRNSGWEVQLIHKGNIAKWLANGDPEDFIALQRFETRLRQGENVGSLAHFADLLRLALLDAHGGIWADATTLCFMPLDHWLPSACSLGMPRSLDQGRRTETWLIDNRCKDPILTQWKLRYRDLYFSGNNKITYLDNWKAKPFQLTYWMLNIAGRNKSWAMRIWNSQLALNLIKVRPYFATNHIFEFVLRSENFHHRSSELHHIVLPIDAELIWEIHISDWRQPITPFMEKRLQSTPLIKLNHKGKWAGQIDEAENNPDSAWSYWMTHSKKLNFG